MGFGGPALAGALLILGSWRWIFIVQLPLTALALAAGWRDAPGSERVGAIAPRRRRRDRAAVRGDDRLARRRVRRRRAVVARRCRPGPDGRVGGAVLETRRARIIRSADPREPPSLQFNYLSTEQDRREWIEAIECARDLFSQPAFRAFDLGELEPGPDVRTPKQILEWVGREAETALHPSCSCRMGEDALAVCDPTSFRVHGLDGLRVVDASVMPTVTNANIYAPVMMIAERAADAILGNAPLPRQPLSLDAAVG